VGLAEPDGEPILDASLRGHRSPRAKATRGHFLLSTRCEDSGQGCGSPLDLSDPIPTASAIEFKTLLTAGR